MIIISLEPISETELLALTAVVDRPGAVPLGVRMVSSEDGLSAS